MFLQKKLNPVTEGKNFGKGEMMIEKILLWLAVLFGTVSIMAIPCVAWYVFVLGVYTPKGFLIYIIQAGLAFIASAFLIYLSRRRLREIKREELLHPKGKLDISSAS